ncbi:SMI1/KNR4 family protein [Yinghuangia seranimata]|uniref:SMI1/KNR4 family protein n=1 Tax=Yinghuangia seranimata TaxID=408067 RepID=UPI00248A9F28|nr:SMI1/KNR4 family protein [Yinghuangia seranimata]MDI2128821.1 hypothetical protein [Yinghuangia seranimata]
MNTTPDSPSHLDHLIELLGEPPWRARADRAADAEAWDQLEHRLGVALPEDYKAFVDLYAPCALARYLWILHPRRGESLLGDMIDGTADLVRSLREYLEDFPPAPVDGFPDLLAWGSHGWEGDTCFFAPESADPSTWTIGVLYRQWRGYFVYAGSFTAFIHGLLTDTLSRTDHPGWFTAEPLWTPAEPWR